MLFITENSANDFLIIYSYYMMPAPCINNINKESINALFSSPLIHKFTLIVLFVQS